MNQPIPHAALPDAAELEEKGTSVPVDTRPSAIERVADDAFDDDDNEDDDDDEYGDAPAMAPSVPPDPIRFEDVVSGHFDTDEESPEV